VIPDGQCHPTPAGLIPPAAYWSPASVAYYTVDCGDATIPEDIETLPSGETPDDILRDLENLIKSNGNTQWSCGRKRDSDCQTDGSVTDGEHGKSHLFSKPDREMARKSLALMIAINI
jgi:hypothetical protein